MLLIMLLCGSVFAKIKILYIITTNGLYNIYKFVIVFQVGRNSSAI